MKNKVVASILVTVLLFSVLTACGKETKIEEDITETVTETTETAEQVSETQIEEVETTEIFEESVATELCNIFMSESTPGKTTEEIADAIAAADCFGEVSITTTEVPEGFLNGFKEGVYGFTSGQVIIPMIGTIPFLSYVFETDDPDNLAESLRDKAALNWNICTEADEMQIKTNGNYVFFVMSPYSFGE